MLSHTVAWGKLRHAGYHAGAQGRGEWFRPGWRAGCRRKRGSPGVQRKPGVTIGSEAQSQSHAGREASLISQVWWGKPFSGKRWERRAGTISPSAALGLLFTRGAEVAVGLH